jgi:hypothetical protein
MCCSDFGDILDADVISIKTARSGDEALLVASKRVPGMR